MPPKSVYFWFHNIVTFMSIHLAVAFFGIVLNQFLFCPGQVKLSKFFGFPACFAQLSSPQCCFSDVVIFMCAMHCQYLRFMDVTLY